LWRGKHGRLWWGDKRFGDVDFLCRFVMAIAGELFDRSETVSSMLEDSQLSTET
jgi:hypothetical protein